MHRRGTLVAWSSIVALAACGWSAAPPQTGGGGGIGGAGGAASEPPAGRCVVVRRLQAIGSTQLPTRLSDGFAFVEANPQPQFDCLLLREDGQARRASIIAPFFPHLRPTVLGTIQAPRILLLERMPGGGSDTQLLGQVVREDGTAVGPEGPVLNVFDRGTALYPQAVALDGAHSALGNAHPAVRNPHFVLVDGDGRPASADIALLETTSVPTFQCFELRGTLHGAVASVVDRDAGMFHVIEVDGAGAIVRKVDQSLSSDTSCPNITVQDDDVYFAFAASNGTIDGGTTALMRLASDGLLPVPELPPPSPGEYYLWVQGRGGSQPLVAIVGLDGVSFARLLQNGTLVRLASDDLSGQLVPSADGRLFFRDLALDPTSPVATTTTITEIRCGSAGG